MIGRLAPYIRLQDVEPPHVAAKRFPVEIGDLVNSLPRLRRALLHLVLAGVGIRHEVPHIGHIHHVANVVPGRPERAFQDILKNIGAEIPDVRVVIDRRAAGVQTDLPLFDRRERLRLSRHGVVQAYQFGIPRALGVRRHPPARSASPGTAVFQ